MTRRILAVLMLTPMLLAAASMAAQAQGSGGGVISGTIVNGTSDTGNVSGIEVTLVTFVDMQEAGEDAVSSGENGGFSFSGLDTSADHLYLAYVDYSGVVYSSQTLSFSGNSTHLEAPITTYEATESDDAIQYGLVHPAIKVDDGQVLVTEYYRFSNTGKATYIGSDIPGLGHGKGTLSFEIPPNAAEVQGDDGLIMEASKLIWVRPLIPGEGEVAYNYIVPAPTSPEYTYSIQIPYPTAVVRVTVSGEGVEVADSGGLVEEKVMTGSGEVTVLRGQDVEPGVVDITLTGFGRGGVGWTFWVVLAAAHIAGFSGLAVIRIAQKRMKGSGEVLEDDPAEMLFGEIAELDDAFERGEIDEASYSRMRAEKKARLAELRSESDQ